MHLISYNLLRVASQSTRFHAASKEEVCNLFITMMEVCLLGSSYLRDLRTRCNGSLGIPWVRERWEVRGGLSLPASPPPEVLRAIRGGSEVCVTMIGGNAIGDVSNSRIYPEDIVHGCGDGQPWYHHAVHPSPPKRSKFKPPRKREGDNSDSDEDWTPWTETTQRSSNRGIDHVTLMIPHNALQRGKVTQLWFRLSVSELRLDLVSIPGTVVYFLKLGRHFNHA